MTRAGRIALAPTEWTVNDIIRNTLGDVIEVREKIVELQVEVRNMAHDIKGLLAALGNFVPRREIDQMYQSGIERDQVLHHRVDAVEKALSERTEAQDRIFIERVGATSARITAVEEANSYLMRKIIAFAVLAAGGGGATGAAIMKLVGGH